MSNKYLDEIEKLASAGAIIGAGIGRAAGKLNAKGNKAVYDKTPLGKIVPKPLQKLHTSEKAQKAIGTGVGAVIGDNPVVRRKAKLVAKKGVNAIKNKMGR